MTPFWHDLAPFSRRILGRNLAAPFPSWPLCALTNHSATISPQKQKGPEIHGHKVAWKIACWTFRIFFIVFCSGFAKGGAWGRVFPNGSGTAICPCKCHCHASAISSLPSKPTHPFRKSYHLCIRKKGGSLQDTKEYLNQRGT